MPVIEITSLEHPGVDVFGTLTEAQLRNRIDPERGIFIAESPKVIRVALDAGYQPLALLCEKNISKEMQPISFFVPVTFPFIRAAASFWQALPATRLHVVYYAPCGVPLHVLPRKSAAMPVVLP